jgi:hypothetical protein
LQAGEPADLVARQVTETTQFTPLVDAAPYTAGRRR